MYYALKNHSPQQDYTLRDVIEKLLKAGANTNRLIEWERVADNEYSDEDEDDESQFNEDALILASRRGLINVVNLLLLNGALASSCNEIEQTSLMVVTQNGYKEVI